MKTTIPLILSILVFARPMCAEDVKSNSKIPGEPGAYKEVGTGDKQHENVIDLYIPKAYAEKKDKKFPVLYMVSCWGCKDFYRLEGWAERAEFILVDVTKVDYRTRPADAKDILRDTDKFLSGLRTHPSLRFIYATWWVGYQASWMYNDNPRSVAGLILSGRTPDVAVERHTTIAVMYGTNPDRLARPSRIEAGIERLQKQKCHVISEVMYGKSAPEDPDSTTLEKVLDAAYAYQSVTNPGLSDNEIDENGANVGKRIAELAKGGSAKERLEKFTALIRVPKIDALKFYKSLAEEWHRAIVEVLKSASAQEAFRYLRDPCVDKLVKSMPAEYRKDFSGPYEEMMKNKDYLHEVAADTAVKSILSHYDEAADRNDEKRLRKVKDELTGFIENYSGTLAADIARATKSCIDVDERKK